MIENIGKLGFIKIKIFSLKDTAKRITKQATEEKIFSDCISEKVLYPEYKKNSQTQQ